MRDKTPTCITNNTPDTDTVLAELQLENKRLFKTNQELREREQKLHNYIREKTDQLLS